MPRSRGNSEVKRSQRNSDWIEAHCRVPEGRLVGQPVKLTKQQLAWMVRIYDSPTRTFILTMGRKNGKTAFAAFLLLLHLCGPESRPNGQLFSAAQSRDQAALLFALAAKIVRQSPDLNSVVIVRDTAKQLACAELGTLYRALSADATTAFGLSPAFVVHDELGQVRGPRSELYEALETAAAAQEEPLSIIISTQSPTDADLLSVLIDDALHGGDERVKVEIYSAPLTADPFAEATIRLANPHFAELMNQDEVFRQAGEAKRMPSREASYRNLILNQRVEARSPFITRMVWEENSDEPIDFGRRPVCGGLDLSSRTDLTALVLASFVDGKWQIRPYFWTPEEGIHERSRRDRVPYDQWARMGLLRTTPGASVDLEYVAGDIMDICKPLNIQAIAYDRWRMDVLQREFDRIGAKLPLQPFGQGFKDMSPALDTLESLLLNKKIAHGKHPVLSMCAANAVVSRDAAGNRKLDKMRASGRIDGLVALAMALGVAPTQEKPKLILMTLG